jgi:SSS family transporter
MCFVVIGVASVLVHKANSSDYLLAGSDVKPWLVALSAVATNNSGYMFIGLIGYAYIAGLHAAWLMVGWILGDLMVSFFVHKQIREKTEETGSLSFMGVICKWNGEEMKTLRFIGGILTLAFLGTYAGAQLSAGSKALHVLFGWDYALGAVIGAVIVVAYCFAGGLRASIWTDAAQSFVMFVAMTIMCVLTISQVGGWSDFVHNLNGVSPTFMDVFPSDTRFGPAMFIAGWMFAGFGVIGQPHIMVRFMAMDDAKNMTRVRSYYYSWFSAFSVLCIVTGLAARLLIPETSDFDSELALPVLAQSLLHPILAGLVLAGLFAATMSTADSQILSCTAAITRDLRQGKSFPYWLTKVSTIFVTAIALMIALFSSDSVFTLVVVAWSALGSAFAPILIVLALGGRFSERLGISMVLIGLGGMLSWRYFGFNDSVYEIMPGMLAGLATYGVGALFKRATKSRDS